jgi:hypothetical protein
MRPFILGLAALAGAAAVNVQPAAAQTVNREPVYPWCAATPTVGPECAFRTWEQCQADIGGLGGFCVTNPSYVEPPPARRHDARGHSM